MTSERAKAAAKLGMLAPSLESNRGKGRCNQSWKSVRMASIQPAGPVGALQWYSRNPMAHGTSARTFTPVGEKSALSAYRPR